MSSLPGTVAAVPTFMALSRFVIANGMTDAVHHAFRERPHLVDNAKGFVRIEVLNPRECPEEIWLLTYWTDAQSYRVWHRSHDYHQAHEGIPKGLKLVPKIAEILLFDYIAH